VQATTDGAPSAAAWLGLENAAVLIAGTGGIGRAVADAFAALGTRLAVVDRSETRIRTIGEELDLERRGGAAMVADLQDPEACRRVVAEAHARLGRLDVFVHAVGMNNRKPVAEFTDAEWREVIDVNLNSAFNLGQAVGKIMCAQKSGRVVFLSSVSGLLAHKLHAPYAATKGAINQMMRVMAAEWAPYDVTVNAIGPGYIETALTAEYLARPGVRAGLESLVPAGRLGTVDDVVGPLIFLASRHASFVTGHVLYVDGGRTLV
jgi:NAD(P)-dependent dehydrogenase (short-subunit alcohol dehydrogenase family)